MADANSGLLQYAWMIRHSCPGALIQSMLLVDYPGNVSYWLNHEILQLLYQPAAVLAAAIAASQRVPLTFVRLVADLTSCVVLLIDPLLYALFVCIALCAGATTGSLQRRQGLLLQAYPAEPWVHIGYVDDHFTQKPYHFCQSFLIGQKLPEQLQCGMKCC